MSAHSPPQGGQNNFVNSEIINVDMNDSTVQHENVAETLADNVTASCSNNNNYDDVHQDTSRSLQTATGDKFPKNIELFNLQKPHLYSDDVYVFIEKINDVNHNMGRLHPMHVGHILHKKLGIVNIRKIDRVGLNRIRVYVNNIKDANKLIQNEGLATENLKAYIPSNLLSRKAVIKHVDTSFNEDYLFENFMSTVAITNVYRVKRKVEFEGDTVLIPKQTVIVTFEGNVLPKYIYLNSVVCVVEPYIQKVIQCYKCLRYGHVAKQCRSVKSLCTNCGKDKDESHTCREPQDTCCIYCKNSEHKSISKDCPSFQCQRKIKTSMANNNLTYLEAKRVVNNNYSNVVSKNPFECLATLDDHHFPPLPTVSPVRYEKQLKPHHIIQQIYPQNQSQNPQHTESQNQSNKKRKATSPVEIAPMFPFQFGPKQPLQYNPYSNNETLSFEFCFNFLMSVFSDIKSFEDFKKIDSEYIKNRMLSFYNSNIQSNR